MDNSEAEAEKITAPRYSYWRSVMRVFFKKKINIIILSILAVLVIFAYVYPMFSGYDKNANLMLEGAKHLSPKLAIEKFGFSIHWILVREASVSRRLTLSGAAREYRFPLRLSVRSSI
ncbi:MAG: hypothetical protein V8S82_08080 [Eubacteriales bacterium]